MYINLYIICVGYHIHHRGAFGVARFNDLPGKCESLQNVERVTDRLHVFLFVYINLKNKFSP